MRSNQKNNLLLPIALLILASTACRHPAADNQPPIFELMDQSATGIAFANNVQNKPDFNIFTYRNFFNGGGVAIGDVNNDGLPDIFFTSNMGANKLYLNKGNFRFEDISEKAGFAASKEQWSTGVVMADVNGDGWLDIYVCNAGHMENGALRKNQLFINRHDNTFVDSAEEYGLADSGYTTQASFFDYDGDGDLDCFIINNSPIPVNTLDYANKRDLPASEWSISDSLKGGGDHLYRNDHGHFTEVTQKAGIHGSLISLGLGVMVGDVNQDGWPDIYVSNDFFEKDYLYINQGNGTFKDELENCMGHTSLASMGADMADLNNDGYPEIFTTDMVPNENRRLKTTFSFENINVYRLKQRSGFYHQFFQNALQLNNRDGKFTETAHFSGVSATDWSWGALMFDADNDELNDIFVSNGIARDLTNQDFLEFSASKAFQQMTVSGDKKGLYDLLDQMPSEPLLNKVYRNLGDLHFQDIGPDWGFTHPSFSNGAAYGDLDNDGDLDLVINNENGPAFLYRNNARQLNHNHYLAVLLHGPAPNTFAIGSKIRVFSGSQVFYREVIPSRGFQSSVDYKQIIGLGNIARPDSMIITWPNGTITKFDHPTPDQLYSVQQSGHEPRPAPPPPVKVTPLLQPVNTAFDRHQEADNVDFFYERNLPRMLSREGPKAATADVNGDGLTDVYIGGTPGHPGLLYLQSPSGQFVKSPQPAFEPFADFEDEAVLFFDANGDGFPDLFVGPGGNSHPPYSRQMQNRLFLNDGHGHFALAPDGALPTHPDGVNTAVAVAGDFNGDGFTDLFVGGRSVPREYGSNPASFIYLNDGHGHFTDIAPSRNPDIAHIGMVTAACWTSLYGNGQHQLIITGEWMAPRIFQFAGNHFSELPSNLDHLYGWWQALSVADLDGDGKPDLILGNIGENFYLRPDSDRPVKLWVYDFDHNGIPDKILTQTIDHRDMPVFLKHDMEDQLPSLKKQNLRHAEYAKRAIQELFPSRQLDSADVKLFNYPSSIVAFNEGDGHFRIQRLPTTVQLSSVGAIRCLDIDQDGHPDLILGGNEFGFLPQFGRLDGSTGDVLLGDGKGHFSCLSPDSSGLHLPGQVRDIAILPSKNQLYLLFLQNDEYPALYAVKPKK